MTWSQCRFCSYPLVKWTHIKRNLRVRWCPLNNGSTFFVSMSNRCRPMVSVMWCVASEQNGAHAHNQMKRNGNLILRSQQCQLSVYSLAYSNIMNHTSLYESTDYPCNKFQYFRLWKVSRELYWKITNCKSVEYVAGERDLIYEVTSSKTMWSTEVFRLCFYQPINVTPFLSNIPDKQERS